MLSIDARYANLLSTRLRNFSKKNDYLWNFSCPVCGDSSKNPRKARGFIYKLKTSLLVKCHRCGYSSNLGKLIKFVDSNLYDQYVIERYKEGATKYNSDNDIASVIFESTPIPQVDFILKDLLRIDTMPESHPAVKYVINRKIPKDKWNLLYFCSKFKKWTNEHVYKFHNFKEDHPRLIIPYFDEFGKVFAYAGRAFGNEQPKYYTIKLDTTKEKIYGLERVDYNKKIYLCEGPIDSLFLPNSLAVSGSSFNIDSIRKIRSIATIVMDNEPRSLEITKQLYSYIKLGYNVVMYPDTVVEKDINDMIKNGKTTTQIIELINTNAYFGMEALLKFSQWKKC